MSFRAALREILSDDGGLLSTARAISLTGALQGAELCNVGLAVAIINPEMQSFALAIIGIGAGFYSSGALLKFGSKAQETKALPADPLESLAKKAAP